MSHLLLSVMGAFAQFERDLIRERQREGIALAKLREGAYVGRKHSLTPVKATELRKRVTLGESKTKLASEYGISRQTLYRYVAGERELKAGRQRVMHCPCGNAKVLALGLCATCYTLKRQDEEYFGGLREAVLERDGYRCRVCDASGAISAPSLCIIGFLENRS